MLSRPHDRDASLQLVHRRPTCSSASTSGCSPAAGSTPATAASSPSPGSYFTLRVAGRPAGRGPRPGGHAARVRERLPPPRRRGGLGRRALHHAAVPLPRVDLRPRRLAARGAALRVDAGFDRSELGLRQAQVDTWGPFIFVNADAEARAACRHARRAAAARGARAGLDVDSLRFHSRAPFSLEANWKIAVENFLECYHCPVAHPSFSDVIDVSPDGYRLETHPTFATHHARLRERPRNSHYDTDGEVEGQFHLIWPNIKVNVMPGRANLSIGPLVPVDAGPHRRLPRLLLRRRTPTRTGSPTTWSSTTRSAPRTACSSSRCSAACARAPSRTAA